MASGNSYDGDFRDSGIAAPRDEQKQIFARYRLVADFEDALPFFGIGSRTHRHVARNGARRIVHPADMHAVFAREQIHKRGHNSLSTASAFRGLGDKFLYGRDQLLGGQSGCDARQRRVALAVTLPYGDEGTQGLSCLGLRF
ncbi:hypothetical protein W911_06000 [Hyphomicrobium nitrativorans NL23]|uniref:Uncharacterized protein n=1 Tax=Hyphomicrobium nitrativorans NL23 TaxID=1029756 RepID=V5SHN2_9HYPH|nr:hypothetical protein W911_06000 [Hyphomicrobium nitrativorans NL23]